VSGSDRVIVVGAGPTGLVLAAELALAGARCLVLERRAGPRTDSRAICLHARSMESLDLRGQAQAFAAAGLAVPSFPLGPRGARIDLRRLDSDFPYLLDLPQSQMEQLMLARALELGVDVRWGSTVTAVAQDQDGVKVTVTAVLGDDPDTGGTRRHPSAPATVERAAYVVGCDGVHSMVRESAGLPFPGFANPGSVTLADLRLDGLPMTSAHGEMSGAGMLLVFPFRDSSCRVVLYDYARAGAEVGEPVTLAEVADGLSRITGRDLRPRDMYWSARYRSESRQVPSYRVGRILLAGDAAHAHSPAGAQGLNTGLQDAVNLGWKLAADLSGRGPDWLLDSYHDERHPVGAAVLALTGRQFRLNTARTPARRALRWGLRYLVVPLPPVQARLARDYSGVSIGYPPAEGCDHRLAGRRLPPGRVTRADGTVARLHDLFHAGRFVLLTANPADLSDDLAAYVDVVAGRVAGLPPAVLVRPDGYIAWASDERDRAALAAACRRAAAFWAGPRATGGAGPRATGGADPRRPSAAGVSKTNYPKATG
jgi:2-polyprenyl-6-methoxyphenol hydroxylase-like FAD-dependent oxidoreductase